MIPNFQHTDGTMKNIFTVGTIVLTDTSSVLEVRDENSVLKKLRTATPVDMNDVVTKGSLLDIPTIRNFMICDYITNIRTSSTTDGLLSEATMLRNGEIVGITAYVNKNRTSGTATFYSTIDGVTQNQSGYNAVINATNIRRVYLIFSTPLQFSAGQSLGVRCVTSSFSPNNTKAVVSLYLRDR
jgi:hypothetical protein